MIMLVESVCLLRRRNPIWKKPDFKTCTVHAAELNWFTSCHLLQVNFQQSLFKKDCCMFGVTCYRNCFTIFRPSLPCCRVGFFLDYRICLSIYLSICHALWISDWLTISLETKLSLEKSLETQLSLEETFKVFFLNWI